MTDQQPFPPDWVGNVDPNDPRLGDGLDVWQPAAGLRARAVELLHYYVVQDLQDAQAAGFDLVGASIKTVAAAKAGWGPRLVPYHSVQQYGIRRIAAYTYRGLQDLAARFTTRENRK